MTSRAFPLIRPGAELVADAKFTALTKAAMFPPTARNRVFVFGNSRTLAGFVPANFDRSVGEGTVSYNLGLPGEVRFLPILESALAAGNVPTHVLLTLPWDSAVEPPTFWDKLRDDSHSVSLLVPFRHLPRDAFLFALKSRMHVVREYRAAASEVDKVLADRGWYFIKSESHFPGDRLPDDFHLPTDRPDQPALRDLAANSWEKQRLIKLANEFKFRIIFIPLPARLGSTKPANGADSTRVEVLSDVPNIRVVGPNVFIYPPRDFADQGHMNKWGAAQYTADLAALLRKTGTID